MRIHRSAIQQRATGLLTRHVWARGCTKFLPNRLTPALLKDNYSLSAFVNIVFPCLKKLSKGYFEIPPCLSPFCSIHYQKQIPTLALCPPCVSLSPSSSPSSSTPELLRRTCPRPSSRSPPSSCCLLWSKCCLDIEMMNSDDERDVDIESDDERKSG